MRTTKEPQRLSDLTSKRRELLIIDPGIIEVEEGFNARDFNAPDVREHIQWLKESIGAVGVQNPLRVRYSDRRVILVNGECRLRAVMELREDGMDLSGVPVYAEPSGIDETDRLFSQITMNSGKGFTLLEQSAIVKRGLAFNLAPGEIAKRMNKSDGHVSNLIKLSEAPAKVKGYIRDGKISATNAIEIIRQFGSEATARIEESISEASASGKDKATAKHVRRSGSESADGIVYNKTAQRALISALQEVYALTDGSQRRIRTIIRGSLENVGAPLEQEEEEE